jgi:hypothetical protein
MLFPSPEADAVVGRDVALVETWTILFSYPQHSVVHVLSLSGRHRGLAPASDWR